MTQDSKETKSQKTPPPFLTPKPAKPPQKKIAKQTQRTTQNKKSAQPIQKKVAAKKTISKKTIPPKQAPKKTEISSPKSVSKLIHRERQTRSIGTKQILRNRKPSEKTLSPLFYKQIQARARGIRLKQKVALLLVGMIGFSLILYYYFDRSRRIEIITTAVKGFQSLEKDDLSSAKFYFGHAHSLYQTYHTWNPDLWWPIDGKLFVSMLRVAQGWRSLGDYQKALDIFQDVAKRNTHGPESWVGRKIDEELVEFINPEYWSEEELSKIYRTLLAINPASWDTCADLQTSVTERVGLTLHPLQERYQQADFIAYGIPSLAEENQGASFLLNATHFYKFISTPEKISIAISSSLAPPLRVRLDWYINTGKKCFVFGNLNGRTFLLNDIDGILLGREETILEFNRIVRLEDNVQSE